MLESKIHYSYLLVLGIMYFVWKISVIFLKRSHIIYVFIKNKMCFLLV